jgi:TP901 family phage tail tape measure protein
MADLNAISIAIDAVDRTSGPVGAAVGSLGRLQSAAGSVGGALVGMGEAAAKAALAVGAISFTAFVAGMTSAVTTAASFEKQISAIGAVSGATTEQLKQFHDLALQLGKDTSFSASEAANGIEELVKAGVSLKDVMGGAAAASLNLAAAGGVSVAESATIASNAMNTFSLKGADMAHVADELAGAANASAIDVHELGFSLSSVGAVAATVGLSLDDTTTAIAVLGQAGLKGSDAGTSLKTMLLNLTPSTKSAKAEMLQLGIITADGANQFFDATGKAKGMADIAGVLQNATKGLTEQQKLQALQTMFGTDAIRAAAIMARAGASGFTDMAEAIGKVSAADVANQRLDNLSGSIEKLKGTMEVASITIGEKFTPVLKRIVDGANDLLTTAMPAIDRFATTAAAGLDRLITRATAVAPAALAMGRSILSTAGYFANVVLYGDSLNDMLTKVPARFQGAAKGAGDFIAQLRSMAGTVATFVSGLNFGGIASGASSFLGGLVGAFQQIAPIAMTVGRSVVANITDTFNFLSTRVLPPVVSMVQQIGAVLTRTLLPASAATGQTMRGIFGDTLDWLANTVFPPFLSIVQQTSDFFTGVILPTLPAVASALRQTLGETVQWLADTVWPKLTAAATVAWGYISTTIAPAIPGIAALIRDGLGKALEWIGTTGWPMLVSGATIAATFITGTLIPAVRDTISWLQEKLPPAIAGITTAWQAVRTTLTPIIQAVMSGDISTAIKGLSSAFSDFATLAGGWLRDQAAKIDWASVWGQTKDVLLSAASWFTDAATRFGTWLGEQAAQINWSDVWSKATAVFETAVVWFANAATLIGGWIGDQVAAIDWASVWTRAVNVVQGTAQWFVSIVTDWATWIGAQVAGIDWASVWAQAKDVILGMAQWFVGAAQQVATWIGAEVAKIDWPGVWANVQGMTAAMQTSFEAQATGLDWHAIVTANKQMATQVGQGLDEQIKAADWTAVGTSFADKLFAPGDGIMSKAWVEGWKLMGGRSDIVKPLVDWITAMPWHDADVALAQAFTGFLQRAWDIATNNWKPSIPWPSWLPGGPNSHPTQQDTPGQGTTPATPNATSGGGGSVMSNRETHAAPYMDIINRVAAEQHESAALIAALIDTENSGEKSVSPAGARGIGQVVPGQGFDLPGEDASDPETSIRQMIRTIKAKRAALGPGASDTDIAGAYFGYGTDAGGMTTGGYRQRFEQQMQNYTSAPQTVPMSNQESTSTGGGNMVTYQDQWGNQFTTTQDKFDQRSKMPGGNSDVTVISRQQGQAAANAAGAQTRPPANMNMMTMPIKNQFDMGLPKDAAEAACGPAAVALFMEATGRTPNRSEVMQIAAKNGWTAERGMGGVEAFKKTLSDEGVNYATLPTTAEAAQQSAAAGNLTAISTPGHYFVAQGFDQQSQRFDLGATGGGPGGALADPRASRFMSAQEIQALEGPINGVIQLLGAVPPAATEAAASLPPVAAGVQGVADASTTATPAVDATTTALTAVPPAAEAAGTGIDALGAGLFDIATAGPAVVVPATETITASFDTMAVGSLQSVTDLGTGVLTTVQDMSGNTVATITDMTGQVTSQSATLASGVSLNMADMGAQSTASVDAMTGNITTVVSDMAGNTITTVSTASGTVVSQFATMQTQAGSSVAQLAATSATEFGKISSAATSTKGPIEGVNTSLQSIKAPNVKPVLDALGSIETAAEQAERAAKQLQQTVGGFGGEKGGGSSKSPFAKGKAVGGSVFAGQAYMVGDGIGPEVFVPDTNGRIIPRISSIAPGSGALYMGGDGQSSGTTITVNLHVEGSVMTEQDLVETVRAGLIDMGRRNGIDVLSGDN